MKLKLYLSVNEAISLQTAIREYLDNRLGYLDGKHGKDQDVENNFKIADKLFDFILNYDPNA